MKLAIVAAASAAVLGLSAGSASAQAVLVPHRGHYHIVPSYSTPYYGGYGYSTYSPGFGYSRFYSRPSYYGGFGGSWGGHHHGHHGHHHHHHHHGGHRHR